MRLLIATKNIGKFREISEVLQLSKIELYHLNHPEMANCLDNDQFAETGTTFEENSKMKALHYGSIFKLPTIGEDSGIIVDALKGELGVKTRRWGAGENASDEEWINHFMNVMKDVPQEKRTARFVCSATFIDDKGATATFKGQTEGIITESIKVPLKEGIPLSSCFIPSGHQKVYAALNENEKNKVSHRGKAFHELKNFLMAY